MTQTDLPRRCFWRTSQKKCLYSQTSHITDEM